MPNVFHDEYIGHNNHALTANPDDLSYANIAARDADTEFQVTENLNKMVRVENPNAYYILFSLGPSKWLEVLSASGSTVTASTVLSDNTLVRGNGGSDLDVGNIICDNAGNLLSVGPGTEDLPSFSFIGELDKGMYSKDTDVLGFAVRGLNALELNSPVGAVNHLDISSGVTASPALITVEGETNAPLTVLPKGTGAFRLESSSPVGVEVVNSGDDNIPILTLEALGANGASIAFHTGTQNPEGIVVGNPGDIYSRVSGVNSAHFVHKGAVTGNTGWVDMTIGTITGSALTDNFLVRGNTGQDINVGNIFMSADGDDLTIPGTLAVLGRARGDMLALGNSTETVISTQNVWVDLNLGGLALAGSLNEKFTLTNTTTGELRYDGNSTLSGRFIAGLSAFGSPSGANYEFRVVVNGSPTTDGIVASRNIQGEESNIVMFSPLLLVLNDLVRMQVQNTSDTKNLTFTNVASESS